MIKAVLDTNVVVSALLQPLGKPAAVLDLVMAGQIDLIVNDAVLAEYEDVLLRPKFGFNEQIVSGFIGYLQQKASRCFAISQPERTPDADDQVFWDLAATNNAVLVTGNTKHYPDSETVMTPARFLDYVRDSNGYAS